MSGRSATESAVEAVAVPWPASPATRESALVPARHAADGHRVRYGCSERAPGTPGSGGEGP